MEATSMTKFIRIIGLVSLTSLFYGQLIAAEGAIGPESPIRSFAMWRTPLVRGKDKKLAVPSRCGSWRSIIVSSPFPGNNWMKSDFNDNSWRRRLAPRASAAGDSATRLLAHDYGQNRSFFLAPLRAGYFVRARFKSAGAGRMKLSLVYRGGAVVYLNGVEVARSDLPQGQLDEKTMATDYPLEAYKCPSGKPIPYRRDSTTKYAANLKKRLRTLEKQIEVKAGVNLLAIAVFRAPYMGKQIQKLRRGNMGYVWSTCGLVGFRLSGGRAVAVPRSTCQVVSGSVAEREPFKFVADPLEAVIPVDIAGTRGGCFTGKVIFPELSSFAGVKANISDLVHIKGKGKIPAAKISLLYGNDVLSSKPPAVIEPARLNNSKAVSGSQPQIWLKIRVPADASPGEYRGKLTVKAGKSQQVPVRLTVADYKLPSPRQWKTLQGLIQSPESVAMQYKVKLWSDAHFKLMENSFQLIGETGGSTLVLYLVGRSCFGNEHTMVRWIKDSKAAGGYRHDFSILERYLDLALKHMQPRVTVLYLWEKSMGGHGRFKYIDKRRAEKRQSVKVTLFDPATGKQSLIDGPLMDGEKFDLSKATAFWKPVCDGVMSRLKKRGLEETAVLGILCDGRPAEKAVKTYKALMPNVLWSENGHVIRIDSNFSGVKIGYSTAVYTKQMLPLEKMFKRRKNLVLFPRGGQFMNTRLSEWSPPGLHRCIVEMALQTEMWGIGRFGADFWPQRKKREGIFATDRYMKRQWSPTINGRFPESNQAQLNIPHATSHLLAPGEAGAISTIRYENLREGAQEAQAWLLVSEALSGGKISGDLARRAKDVLNERNQYMRSFMISGEWKWCASMAPVLSRKLFNIAAEVQK
jgi:Glycoside hydrolase 123, catalytic domain